MSSASAVNQAGAAMLPEQRPIAWRDYALLLTGMAIVAAPHALRAPWWLIVLTVLLYEIGRASCRERVYSSV